MKVNEVLNEGAAAPSATLEGAKKAVDTVMNVGGARMESILELDGDRIAFEVEYDFPEHLVKGSEVKAAGKPVVKKVAVEKAELWREGVYGAGYTIDLATPLAAAEVKELKKYIVKKYKPSKDYAK